MSCAISKRVRRIRRREQKIVHVPSEVARVDRVHQRVLGSMNAACQTDFLRFGDNLKREGVLASVRAINLNDRVPRGSRRRQARVNQRHPVGITVHGHRKRPCCPAA